MKRMMILIAAVALTQRWPSPQPPNMLPASPVRNM